ncbi:MAG: hypothetical protein HYX78_14870 [Armatimonadetes bacterium]|nr:hypothetical protein [Armatimonadota bacterium]
MRGTLVLAFTVCVCMVGAFGAGPAWAAPRSTPVQVVNLLGIDPNSNTVKAQQLGDWNVAIAGTPSVAQSGAWNVGISGTPSVNIANTPTVRIDGTDNIVTTSTKTSRIQLWTTSQEIAPGGAIVSPVIDCAGYRDMRFTLGASTNSADLEITIWFLTGLDWGYFSFGTFNFAPTTETITTHANFRPTSGFCHFIIPAMSDRCYISIKNNTAGSATVYDMSWVYLVN